VPASRHPHTAVASSASSSYSISNSSSGPSSERLAKMQKKQGVGVGAESDTCLASTSGTVQQVEAANEPPARLQKLKSNFCRMCGSTVELRRPEGEKEWRHVCSSPECGHIEYFNPKMVVGCIVEHQGKILLCKRAIEPCRGKWTVPAGFMELGESTAQGAARETWEEACAPVRVLAPYAHWDIPAIGQAYILFRAQLAAPFTFSPGTESLETALFEPQDIPFDQIAFSSVSLTLRYYLEDLRTGRFHVHHGVIDKRPGSGPNDPASFEVKQHMALPLAL